MRLIWIAFAISCSVPQEAPVSAPHVTGPAPHETLEPPPTPEEPDPGLDPTTMCGRAEVCCQAFAAAVPNVVAASACAGPTEASTTDDADERCERMMAGWQAALERHSAAEAPPECSPALE